MPPQTSFGFTKLIVHELDGMAAFYREVYDLHAVNRVRGESIGGEAIDEIRLARGCASEYELTSNCTTKRGSRILTVRSTAWRQCASKWNSAGASATPASSQGPNAATADGVALGQAVSVDAI